MEAALEAHHRGAARRRAGELHRVLHGLRPCVEEGCLAVAAAGDVDEAFGQLDVGLVRDHREVGVRDLGSLPLHRLDDLRVRIAHQLAAEAAREVHPRVAVDVGEPGALAVVDDGRDMDVQRVADHA